MSKKSGYLLGILLTIIIGTILYWFFCCQYCTDTTTVDNNSTHDASVKPDVTFKAFTVKDPDGNLSIDIKDNFNFNASDFHFIEPISPNLQESLSKLSAYFEENPNKSLDITGYYKSHEINNSAFPNIGLARANVVKNLLASEGVAFKSMNTFGVLDDQFKTDTDDILHGPISLKVSTLEEGDTSQEEALTALGDKIKANPLVLHFNTAQTSINLTAQQRQKVADIVNYVDKVDGATITVTGHTDNEGSRDTNVKVGQGRADFAKNYLIENGIPTDKILSTSVGPDQPIADNSTEEGRAENRRVVITIN